MTVHIIHATSVPDHLDRLCDLLRETEADWSYYETMKSLVEAMVDSNNVLLCFDLGVAYTLLEIVTHPSGNRSLTVRWSSGDHLIRYAPEAMEQMERIARICDLDRLQLYGRPGWKKVLAPFGVQMRSHLFVKDIDYEQLAEQGNANDETGVDARTEGDDLLGHEPGSAGDECAAQSAGGPRVQSEPDRGDEWSGRFGEFWGAARYH